MSVPGPLWTGDLTGALVKRPFVGSPRCRPDKARRGLTPHTIRARIIDPACRVAPLPDGPPPRPQEGLRLLGAPGATRSLGGPSRPSQVLGGVSPPPGAPQETGWSGPQAACARATARSCASGRRWLPVPHVAPASATSQRTTAAWDSQALDASSTRCRTGPPASAGAVTYRVTPDHFGEEPRQAVIGQEAVGASQVQALHRGHHAPGSHHGGRVGNELHICGERGRQRGCEWGRSRTPVTWTPPRPCPAGGWS